MNTAKSAGTSRLKIRDDEPVAEYELLTMNAY